MTILYNEIEPFATAWLRNLAAAGHIAAGAVDERSIHELRAADVIDATQAHFFAGIGVWSYALRMAGWPDDVPVWTGSCPCQPFSAAGKRKGTADIRHLWPEWFRLIRECRPPVIFGEQVASAGDWLDLVSSDLEGEGYAFGAAVLGAHSVGAPHIRQRLYFVAHAQGARQEWRDGRAVSKNGSARLLADSLHAGRPERRPNTGDRPTAGSGSAGELGDAGQQGPQGRQQRRNGPDQQPTGQTGLAGFWSDTEWIPCRDGKSRPVESGTFPLAHGAASRVGRLRAYGNALNAEQAALFIRAAMSSPGDRAPRVATNP